MSAYIHGNLAIKEMQHARSARRPRTKPGQRPGKAAMSSLEKMFYLSAIVLLILLCGVLLFQYAQVYAVNMKIQDIEREIERLEKENGLLKLESQSLKEPKKLIEWGKQLGFQPTSEKSVIPVSPNKHIALSKEENIAYVE